MNTLIIKKTQKITSCVRLHRVDYNLLQDLLLIIECFYSGIVTFTKSWLTMLKR